MSTRKIDTGDGRQIAVQITIKVWTDGAMSVEGPIDDKLWVIATLENAKDAVRNHRDPRVVDIVVPTKDVSIA
jgi:hypothetical protein